MTATLTFTDVIPAPVSAEISTAPTESPRNAKARAKREAKAVEAEAKAIDDETKAMLARISRDENARAAAKTAAMPGWLRTFLELAGGDEIEPFLVAESGVEGSRSFAFASIVDVIVPGAMVTADPAAVAQSGLISYLVTVDSTGMQIEWTEVNRG